MSEAADRLGVTVAALKKRCQRGKIPGATKTTAGNRDIWMIPAATMAALLGDSAKTQYDALHAEWISRMERGFGYKKPISPRGVEAYVYGMARFWLYLEDPPALKRGVKIPPPKRTPNLNDISKSSLMIALANVPIDRSKQNCHYSLREKMYLGFRAFFKFLVARGLRSRAEYLELDEARPIRIYEERRPVLDENELAKLLEANSSLLTGRRKDRREYDRALTDMIIYLAAVAGLRREEICDLELGHVDLAGQLLNVVDGKGNKNRQVGISADLCQVLDAWIRVHRPKSKHPHLLVGLTGEPVTPNMVYMRVRRIGKQAGLSVVNPHALRRTCASVALENDIPLHHIADAFGHSSTRTTERSYVKVSKRKAIASFQNFRPLKTMPSLRPGRLPEDLERLEHLDRLDEMD